MQPITVTWTIEDIRKRQPTWSDEKCWKFLDYVKSNLLQAAESAGDGVIDRLIGDGEAE